MSALFDTVVANIVSIHSIESDTDLRKEAFRDILNNPMVKGVRDEIIELFLNGSESELRDQNVSVAVRASFSEFIENLSETA